MSTTHDNEGGLSERDQARLERGRREELLDVVRDVLGREFEEFRTTLPEIVRPVVRDQVKDSLARYYGDRDPEQVLEIIRSAEKWHKRIDDLSKSFWTGLLAQCLKWGFWIFLVGFFATHTDLGKHAAGLIGNPMESH
jgi:hypothetical protein